MDKVAISRYSSFLVKTFGIEGELNYYFEREDSSKTVINFPKVLDAIQTINAICSF